MAAESSPITVGNHGCCEHMQADLHAIGQMVTEMYAVFTANRPVLEAMARGSLAGAAAAARRSRKAGER